MNNKVSIIIPAYNEEKTIKNVIRFVKKENLVDEIIVVDNASIDRTAEFAKKEGAIVVNCKDKGKGYAMKAGLMASKNDIVVFLDADCKYDKNIVYKMTEKIINNEFDFIKADFKRARGRVTELVAKPLLEIVFPDFPKFGQPLSGMIAAKKKDLEKIEFINDYGVDIALLLDVYNAGLRIGETYIGKVVNRAHELNKLAITSKEVMQAILKRKKV